MIVKRAEKRERESEEKEESYWHNQ